MIVEIKVFASLRHHLPASEDRLDGDKWRMPEGARVSTLLDTLHLPEAEAKLVLVNGRKAEKETRLSRGDVIHVFPPMCGG